MFDIFKAVFHCQGYFNGFANLPAVQEEAHFAAQDFRRADN
jgi:hypothetical protein